MNFSDETRRRMSESAKRRRASLETRQKMANSKRGKHLGRSTEGHFVGEYFHLCGQEEHPLATRGQVAEHRFVLYNEIGPGPHLCHWGCGKLLEWGGREGIQADHVDGDTMNNHPENLVPSCSSCNCLRALEGNPTEWCFPLLTFRVDNT